jgi:opacity protein-like surface antigen
VNVRAVPILLAFSVLGSAALAQTQAAKNAKCFAEADARGLHGQERSAFREQCKSSADQTVSAQSPWYIEGSAGALWRMDATRSTTIFNSLGTTGPGTNTTTFFPGAVFNLGLGYKLPWGFRIEAEGGYAHYSAESVSPLSTNGAFPLLNGNRLELQSGGARDQYSATFNAFYDLPMFGQFIPYVGAGIGVNTVNSQDGHFAGVGGVPRFTQLGGSGTNAAVLGEVGMTITLNAKWSVVPSYRFEKVFTNAGAFPNQANIFKLGLRYSL